MLVVRLFLWPGGDESQARELGRINIANDGSGDPERGNYDVELLHSGSYWGQPGAWKKGRVLNYLRELSPYHLVLAALEKTIGRPGVSHGAAPVKPASRAPMRTSICKGCGASIAWGLTENGRKIPLETKEIRTVPLGPSNGSIGLNVFFPETGKVEARKRATPGEPGSVVGYESHFAHCKQADSFRKDRAAQ